VCNSNSTARFFEIRTSQDFILVMDLCMQFGVTKEAAGMDKYLQMQQDQVPFRVRAKRGCATHPRSIAERVLYIYIYIYIRNDWLFPIPRPSS
jgi:hypothetical protein